MAENNQRPNLTERYSSTYWSCIVFFVFSLLFCSPTFAQQGIFSDATSSLGIDYSYGLGIEYQYGLISFNGGFSFADFNGDGLDDLTFGSVFGDTIYMYTNTGDSYLALPTNARFNDVGLSSCFYWIDYDNDDDKDLYVTNIGAYNRLYRNDGDLNFTDVTFESEIISGVSYTYSACWADFDLDGWLDLYYVNRNMSGIAQGNPPNSPNFLFRNKGDGTFENITVQAGVQNSSGLGYAVVAVDYNNDGWPDLYVGNDKDTCNKLYKNNGDGTFEDVSEPSTTGLCISSMGIDLADYDGNGYLDMYVTNGPGGNLLLQNNGDDTFNEVGTALGLSVNHNGWGTVFEDFDNDGDEDIFAVNGGSNILEWQRNPLFNNQGDGTFIENETDSITLNTYHTYGASAGDWNDDGYIDIAVMNVGGDPVKFWQNNGGTNNWFKLNLEGVLSNKDAIGTWIEVWCEGQKFIKYTTCGNSFASQFSNDYIFGLASYEQVDSVVLRFPSGVINTYYDLEVNQKVTFVEDPENSTGECMSVFYPDTDSDGFGDMMAPGSNACVAPEGYVANNLDCNDEDESVYPDAPEICDGVDNNCNDLVDEDIPVYTYYLDVDNDGFGDPLMAIDTCLSTPLPGYVSNDLDCATTDSNTYPDAPEICDGVDNNCNDLIDEDITIYTYYLDIDNDGFGDPLAAIDTCLSAPLPGYVTNDLDCATEDNSVYPNAPEICDGIDNNCNDLVDEDITIYTYYLDDDEDGFGDPLMAIDTCLETVPLGYVENNEDCDDDLVEVNPNADEIPNNDIDEDCDGEILTVGIEEFGADYYITLAPNPVVDNLTVKHSLPFSATLHIINNLNKVVAAHNLPASENTAIISLNQLPSGVYYVIISNLENDFKYSKAIVKIR